jgi:hypothetical protein
LGKGGDESGGSNWVGFGRRWKELWYEIGSRRVMKWLGEIGSGWRIRGIGREVMWVFMVL